MPLSDLMGLLQQYAGGSTPNPGNVENDFNQVAQATPQSHLAGGLSEAFRSNQTPPFSQMLGTLFQNSNGQQRADVLNRLLPSVNSGALSGILGGLMGGGGSAQSTQITPQQAQQLPPEAVHQIAAEAEKNNPSVVDEVSSFYSQHPTVVKTLGAGALALIMSHISSRV